MTIDWFKFIAALICLLPPAGLFHGPKVGYRPISRDWNRHWAQIARFWLHYVDFARAALGTWLLLGALHADPDAAGHAKYTVIATQGLIRILAVWLQTVVCRQPDSVNAPFAFVAGLLLTGVSPLVAVIALGLAIPLAAGARASAAFFPLLAIAFAADGFIFGGASLALRVIPGACAALLPWLWSLLFRRKLVIAYRLKRSEDAHSRDPLR